MSLATLVAFAQEYFGALAENSTVVNALDLASVDEALHLRVGPPRLGLPAWLRQRTPDQEIPGGSGYPWRIEGPIDPREPAPDENALGADALAFYAPFHFYRKGWGIFIRLSGVVHLATILKGARLCPGDEGYLDVAEMILEEHEWHHASTEIACTRAELLARHSLYQRYFVSPAAAVLEEALANAQAITWSFQAGDPLGARSRAGLWMSQQGPGYCDYGRWLATRSFSEGLDRAARFMAGVLPGPRPRANSSLHTFLYRGARTHRSMPITRVNDLGATRVSVLRPFPKAYGVQVFVHSNDHPPPHIHVEAPPGGRETRYSWPELVPLESDKPLPSYAEKGLRRYVEEHGAKIEARVKAVYGHAQAKPRKW